MKVNEASHRLTLMLCMMHKKCYLKIAAGRYFCIRSFSFTDGNISTNSIIDTTRLAVDFFQRYEYNTLNAKHRPL